MEQRRRPFPYFALWLLLMLLILLFLVLRYAFPVLFAKEPPQITITAGEQNISWVVAKNRWNGSQYDREPTFVLYGQQGLLPSQLPAGTEITVTMGGTLPDEVTLREYALDSNEQSVYGESRLTEELLFYFSGKTGSFTLPQPGSAPIRGYLLTCTWGENVCEYAIVVQILDSGT